jgi:gas vesicle protein
MNATRKTPLSANEKDGASLSDRIAETARDGGKALNRGVEDMTTAAKRGAEDVADTVTDSARDVAKTAEKAVANGQSSLDKVAGMARETVGDAKDALVSGAGNTIATVRDAAIETADHARETLSDVGDRIAATLERASESDDSDALKSRLFHSLADGLNRASTTLRQRSVADLTDDVNALARRHPGVFMAAAAVAGFAAARFLRSSAQRRSARELAEKRDHRA